MTKKSPYPYGLEVPADDIEQREIELAALKYEREQLHKSEPLDEIVARWEDSDPDDGHHRVLATDLSALIASWRERGEKNAKLVAYFNEYKRAFHEATVENTSDLVEMYESKITELVAALEEFVDAAQYDAMMEGPKFKGWNRSQLDRALVKARAALAAAGHKGEENGR